LIGDRTVPSEQKLVSIYEPDLKVIVRGKAGKEVEFGNTLFSAESAQGLILDWELYRQKAPPEWRQLQESIERQNTFDLPTEISAAGADRGFAAKAGKAALQASGIYDAVCTRNPAKLKARLQESQFVQLQRRRGSTEARVAIFKQRSARRLRCRGFAHRHLAVAWVVIGHNIRVLARMLIKQEKLKQAA
jgi:hypothetical protein